MVTGLWIGLAVGAPAAAASFYVVHSGVDAWTVLDPASVQRDAGAGRITTWTVTVQRNLVGASPAQPGYIRTLNDYDCASRRIRWHSFLAYSRYGALVMQRENASPDWVPVPDGGEAEAALRVLCDGVGGGSVVSAGSMAQLVIALMQVWDPAQPASAPPAAAQPQKKPGAGSAPRPNENRRP